MNNSGYILCKRYCMIINQWNQFIESAERFKKRNYPVGVIYTRYVDLIKGRIRLPLVLGRALPVYNIELTNRCSCRCITCPRTYAMSRPLGSMNMVLYRSIIDQIADRQKIIILHNFGDPLLHPDIEECIAYANIHGLKVRLSTIGNLLTESLGEKIMRAGLDEINFSLDAVRAVDFNKTKGFSDAYETTIQRVRHFIGEKIRLGARVRITISMIGRLTKEDARTFIGLWNIHGVDKVTIKWFHTYDGSVENIKRLSPEKIDSFLDRGVSLCRFPWEKITVMWNGDVVPCCLDFNAKYKLGNLLEQTVISISEGKEMQLLRADLRSGHPKNLLCSQCIENRR